LPASKRIRPKTVPKSFRIDESALIATEREAQAQRVSANTLVNQILNQFAEFDRFANKIGTVKVSSFIFRGILQAAEVDKVIEVARSAGSSLPQALVTAKSGKVDFNSLLDHLRSLATYAHLYEYNESSDPRALVCTLLHEFGLNWSIFLVHYVTSMFEQLGIAPKIEMSDRSVIITITGS
jgi:hypothetical protein